MRRRESISRWDSSWLRRTAAIAIATSVITITVLRMPRPKADSSKRCWRLRRGIALRPGVRGGPPPAGSQKCIDDCTATRGTCGNACHVAELACLLYQRDDAPSFELIVSASCGVWFAEAVRRAAMSIGYEIA